MTKANFQKEKTRILSLFETPLPIDKEIQNLQIKKAKKNFFYFFKTYLAHYLEHPTASFQREIIRTLEGKHKYIAIAAPRGFAKSTLVSLAYVIWIVICKKYHFIVIISATDDLAYDLSQFIRLEFGSNPLIIRDFGKVMNQWGAGGDFIANNTRIFARGRMQATRGFRHREHRPDLIILDDIEKDEEAMSPMTTEKTLSLIKRALIPSMDPRGKIIAVGTLLRKKSAFAQIILEENFWEKLVFKALITNNQGKEQSIWEKRFSTKFLQQQRSIMGISAFNAEYQNTPNSEEHLMFKESMIKEGCIPACCTVMFIDPSLDGVKNGDFKACVMIRGSAKKIEVLDAVFIKGSDRIFFTQICRLYQEHSNYISSIGFESNGFQHYFGKELQKFAQDQEIHLPLKATKNYLKKEYRIQKLLSFFETERIVFNPEFLKSEAGTILKDQLCSFPNSRVHDDGPDALAGAIELLINLEISFQNQQKSILQIPSHKKSKFIP